MSDAPARMFAPLTAEERAAVSRPPPVRLRLRQEPIIPVPGNAPPMEVRHPEHGAPTESWPYHTADGALVGYTVRFDVANESGPTGKVIMPVAFCNIGEA